jgi:hypothetical protein
VLQRKNKKGTHGTIPCRFSYMGQKREGLCQFDLLIVKGMIISLIFKCIVFHIEKESWDFHGGYSVKLGRSIIE